MTLTRQQFEDTLKYNFYPQINPPFLSVISICTNDKSGMDAILTQYLRCNGRIAFYLSQYDAASTDAQRDAVVAGVSYDIGTASVDPNSAIFWPDSNGRFGNIKGPSSSTSGNMVGFSSATGQLAQDLGAPVTISRSQSSASRSLNTVFQISTTRDSLVNYSVDISCVLSLTSGQTGTAFLEIATNSGFTTGVQEVCRFVNGNTGTLTIGLNLTQNCTGGLNGFIPAGYFCRIRTANTTGTPTFTYRSGQEVLL